MGAAMRLMASTEHARQDVGATGCAPHSRATFKRGGAAQTSVWLLWRRVDLGDVHPIFLILNVTSPRIAPRTIVERVLSWATCVEPVA